MEQRAAFDTYLELLRRVVAARGGDPDSAAAQFVWTDGPAAEPTPKAAVSLSPLLTGTPGETPAAVGVAAVPAGLTPPKP